MNPILGISSVTAVAGVFLGAALIFTLFGAGFFTPVIWLRLMLAGGARSRVNSRALEARVWGRGPLGEGGITVRGRPSYAGPGVAGVIGHRACVSAPAWGGGVIARLMLFVFSINSAMWDKQKTGLTP